MPRWQPKNLEGHRDKHKSCFADIYGLSEHEISLGKYEALSLQCIKSCWLQFLAKHWNSAERVYKETRCYFVDDNLTMAVTTEDQEFFFTFYHEHFDAKHGKKPPKSMSAGEVEIYYRDHLDKQQKGKIYKDLKLVEKRNGGAG